MYDLISKRRAKTSGISGFSPAFTTDFTAIRIQIQAAQSVKKDN